MQFDQPRSVIENNTIRGPLPSSGLGKSIIKTNIDPKFISYHKPTINRLSIKQYRISDNIIYINHYRYNSWEFMLAIKLSRGGAAQGTRRWAFKSSKSVKDSLRLIDHSDRLVNDNLLKKRSNEFIKHINNREQTKPQVDIYNNTYYHKVKQHLDENPKIKPGTSIESINKFNKYIMNILSTYVS